MPISQKSLHVMLHLFLVYISWGSTYIGYKFSLGVAGPFLVGGSRMVIGGILLALFLMLTGRWIRPERKDWIHATWMGVFMVLLASGFLAKGQERTYKRPFFVRQIAGVPFDSLREFLLPLPKNVWGMPRYA